MKWTKDRPTEPYRDFNTDEVRARRERHRWYWLREWLPENYLGADFPTPGAFGGAKVVNVYMGCLDGFDKPEVLCWTTGYGCQKVSETVGEWAGPLSEPEEGT